MKKIVQKSKWVFVLALLFIPLVSKNRYVQDIMIMTFLWAGLATSWNINCGYSRRLSIGHGAFLGIGAYVSSLLFIHFNISPWIGMFVGGLISVIVAYIIGKSTLRLKGTYFVLSTIAFSEVLRIFAMTSRNLTGGSMGLLLPFESGTSNMMWNSKIPYALIMWAYMLILLVLSDRLERTKFGYSLISIGEDREAAEVLGVDTTHVMVKSFLQSAFLTSIGGSLFAQYIMYIEPNSVMGLTNASLQFILIAIIGGMGTAFGPLIGAVLLIPLSTLLRGYFTDVSGLHGLFYGVLLLGVVLLKPEGLIIQIRKWFNKIIDKLFKKGDYSI